MALESRSLSASLSRYLFLQLLILAIFFYLLASYSSPAPPSSPYSSPASSPASFHPLKSEVAQPHQSTRRTLCRGPRGALFRKNNDDRIEETIFDDLPDDLLLGTFDELPLTRAWATADGRYAPYGRGQDDPQYNRTKVDWSNVDWGLLQSECFEKNKHRFGPTAQPVTTDRRMSYPPKKNAPKIRIRPPITTGRTAIVLRGWEEFVFHEPNQWYIRSLIAETALFTDADFSVFLLIDVHDKQARIFDSKENYDAKLEQLAPPEYRNMTVLWDEHLLKAWYPKVSHHGMRHQLFQPLQLFAQFFDDYDHYWQLEMDMRFTGHAGRILESFSNFAKREPRKQARERASFMYTPKTYGTYANFLAQVNQSLSGGSSYWQGIRIPDVEPIGPSPPVSNPEDDDFVWGVGEEADLVMLGACSNLTLEQHFQGYNYRFVTFIENFQLGARTPRINCPPAMGRSSWNLLNGIHNLQVEKGLQVPSEVHLPSFTMWLNLKISKVPFPMYLQDDFDPDYVDKYLNGVRPLAKYHGMAKSTRDYRFFQNTVQRPQISFRSHSGYAKDIFNAWLNKTPEELGSKIPNMLRVHQDKLYAPNCILHPAKFNPATKRPEAVDPAEPDNP